MSVAQRTGNYSRVTALRLSQGATSADVVLGAPDAEGRSTFTLPDGFEAGPVRIEITASAPATTRDRRYGDIVQLPAAITEIGNVARTQVPTTFDTGCRDDLVQIDGVAIPVRVRGSVADALAGAAFDAERCDDAPQLLDEGTHRVTTDTEPRSGLQVDRVVLTPDAVEPTAAPTSRPTATVTSSDRLHRTVQVDGCPDGCWLVLGEGYHQSWSARTDDGSLGPPQLVDGGFNGWWIPPSSTATTVHIAWTAQGPLDVALAVSLATVVMAVVLVVADRRRPPPSTRTAPASWLLVGASDGLARSAVAAAAWVVGAALFVTPRYAVWGLLGGLVLVAARRVRVAGVVAIVALGYIAYEVVDTVRTEHPEPTPLFPGRFEQLHHLGLFAAVSLAVTLAARARRRPAR